MKSNRDRSWARALGPVAVSAAMTMLAMAAGLYACSRQRPRGSERHRPSAVDANPIDVNRFADDAAVRRQVLEMPCAQVVQRLGALEMEARTHFVFSRGGQEYPQDDVYRVRRDALGRMHVVLDTPKSQVEMYVLPDTIYVRHNRGRLRKKPRQNMEAETWCDLAWASLAQTLELFGPRAHFNRAGRDRVVGRTALRFNLSLAEAPPEAHATASKAPPQRPVPTSLPIAPLPRWRQLAQPLDLEGRIWIDEQTGVILRTEVKGRVEISDREVRPTQLAVRYDGAIAAVGEVAAVVPPKAVEEYTRRRPTHDLLSFFEEELRADPASSAAPTTGAQPAGNGAPAAP